MDRGWMYNAPRPSKEYIDGVFAFVKNAVADMRKKKQCQIYCPCKDCDNKKTWYYSSLVSSHLIRRGFTDGYKCWTKHGEENEVTNNMVDVRQSNDGMACDDDVIDKMNLDQMLRDAEAEICNKKGGQGKFEELLEAQEKKLYPGCDEEHTLLHFTLELLKLKAAHGWSDTGFDELLQLIQTVLPQPNELPTSTYDAKKIICPLGLEVQKIHACPKHCILYRKKYADLTICPKCQTPRFKNSEVLEEAEQMKKGIPALVMWYFSIIPRLKRFFANPRDAELTRWHEEKRKKDRMLRHPADASQWRNIDRAFPKFSCEPRNLRFGLSTDGMNPFGDWNSTHSTWPVLLCMYNLPPWLCMNRKYIMMPILIQGPKQPGNDIDVFLEPLMEDFAKLWDKGVRVWDESKQEYFKLRALLFVTTADYPANGNLSGQTTKGAFACLCCGEQTCSVFLKNSWKTVYMRHRRFLRKNHKYRSLNNLFDGTREEGVASKPLSGEQVFELVKDVNVSLGKRKRTCNNAKGKNKKGGKKDKGGKKVVDVEGEKNDGENKEVEKEGGGKKKSMWKKRSIFWDYLPYWKFLEVRHSIDVMHLIKNVCESCMGCLLHIRGKTKDGIKSRKDLADMNIRPELHPEERPKGKSYLPPACFTLSKDEKRKLCQCLHDIKVPTGYSSNIRRLVSMKDLKVSNMKAHDCHVLMTQLLPVAIRHVKPSKVRTAITQLCHFFNIISQKVIDPITLASLQDYVVETVCLLEMCFPPSFFDIMVHLLVHVVHEIKCLGPVYLHQMWPFERYMAVLKKWVRNRARPEGCIVEGYTSEEVVQWCIDYLNHRAIGVPSSRHEGRLMGKGVSGKKTFREAGNILLEQAHFTVLQQLDVMSPYVSKHLEELRYENQGRPGSWITKEHRRRFIHWLKGQVPSDNTVSHLIRGPSSTVVSWQAYDINGYTFYTSDKDSKSKVQNSGVRIDALDHNGESINRYYGIIEEIWELDYGTPGLKIPVFRCKWVKLPKGLKVDKFGFTIVDLNEVGYQHDPFVLADQVTQVFYVKDPKTDSKENLKRKATGTPKKVIKNSHVVLQGKRRRVGVDKRVEEELEMPPFLDPENLEKMEENLQEAVYARTDHDEGLLVRD